MRSRNCASSSSSARASSNVNPIAPSVRPGRHHRKADHAVMAARRRAPGQVGIAGDELVAGRDPDQLAAPDGVDDGRRGRDAVERDRRERLRGLVAVSVGADEPSRRLAPAAQPEGGAGGPQRGARLIDDGLEDLLGCDRVGDRRGDLRQPLGPARSNVTLDRRPFQIGEVRLQLLFAEPELAHGVSQLAFQLLAVPDLGGQRPDIVSGVIGALAIEHRTHVRVRPADVLKTAALLVEARDHVAAEERERPRAPQLVPHLLERDRRAPISAPPEQIDHLAVGPDLSSAALRAGPLDDRAHRPREPLPVGGRADHELVERLLRIDHDEAVGRDPTARIEPPRGQPRDEGAPVRLGGDDDRRRVLGQAVRQKVDHGGLQQILALVELDDVRRLGVGTADRECRAAGRGAEGLVVGGGRIRRHSSLPRIGTSARGKTPERKTNCVRQILRPAPSAVLNVIRADIARRAWMSARRRQVHGSTTCHRRS